MTRRIRPSYMLAGLVACLGVVACGRIGFDRQEVAEVDQDSGLDPDAEPLRFEVDGSSQHRFTTCAVASGGLYCWGSNATGQVFGAVNGESVLSPRQIGTELDWSLVSVGSTHVCALKRDQSLWCWGTSDVGATGLGAPSSFASPTQVAGGTGQWLSMSTNESHTCAISSDDELWCWGENLEGQLAQEDGLPRFVPTRVGQDADWTAVSTGSGHTCGLRGDELWCWGRNTRGEIAQPAVVGQSRDPLVVSTGWTDIVLSTGHGCGIRQDQSLWCWGGGFTGQLGQGDLLNSFVPVQVGTFLDWTDVEGGHFHTCARRSDNSLWCWGRSIEGQLGNGEIENVLVPSLVETTQVWQDVSISRFSTCAIDSERALWCTGENAVGQLGIGSIERPYEFTLVEFP